jgi:hypothetical protein
VLCLGVAWLIALDGAAQAPEARVSFHWHGRSACSAPHHAPGEVARLLGERYEQLTPTAFDVEVSDTAQGRHVVRFRFADAPPESARVLSLASCDEVREASVLLAAMALDPSLAWPKERVVVAVDAPDEERALSRSLALSVGAILDGFSLPGVSGGPSLGVALTLERLRLGAHVRYLAPREVDGLAGGGRAQVDLIAGALEMTWAQPMGHFELGPTAEVELGALRGRASRVETATDGGAFWGSFWGGVHGGFRVRKGLTLLARALVGVPVQRPRFALAGEPAFHATAPLTLRLMIGISFSSPPTD